MQTTTDLTVQQIAADLHSLWERAYEDNDKTACVILEASIQQIEQFDQNALVALAEREQLYSALTRYQETNRRLQQQAHESYLDGYNDGADHERKQAGDEKAIYQDGHTAGWQAAQEHYEPKLRKLEEQVLRRKVGF